MTVSACARPTGADLTADPSQSRRYLSRVVSSSDKAWQQSTVVKIPTT